MGDLYLTRLTLAEFRTFSKLEIELPDGPCVLLVTGPNGLGKSTLFDGLEWCLAGEIDRFHATARGITAEQYLRRWGAPEHCATRVDAAFGNTILASGFELWRKMGDEGLRMAAYRGG